MRTLITFITLAMLGCLAAAGQGGSLNVYVESADMAEFDEHSVWGPIDATGSLVASIHKFADSLQVVADREQACFTIKSRARARRKAQSTASRVFIGRKAAAYVSVEVVSSSGITVFANEAKDTSKLMEWLVGDFNKEGPSKATDRIAKRMSQAARKWSSSDCPPALERPGESF